MTWQDFRRDDRVWHHEHGTGTVRVSGPVYIYISWDDPKYEASHSTSILRHLQRPGS